MVIAVAAASDLVAIAARLSMFATEVLLAGVNLHRSNIVINHHIPWNPTRLIQHVGRLRDQRQGG